MAMICPLTKEHFSSIIAIAEDLSEWYTEHARRKAIPVDIRHQGGFVSIEGGVVVGFVTFYVSEGKLNIGWLGVLKARQRMGIGKALLQSVDDKARELGISEIAASTLGDGVDYPPYEQTRQFYFKNGFTICQRSKTDNPECPEEIRISRQITKGAARSASDKARR